MPLPKKDPFPSTKCTVPHQTGVDLACNRPDAGCLFSTDVCRTQLSRTHSHSVATLPDHRPRHKRDVVNSTETLLSTKTPSSTKPGLFRTRRLLQHVPAQLTLCSSDPCPGMMSRNPASCACECERVDDCPGNQVWKEPICQCGCETTPTCIAPLTFSTVQVE